MLDAYRTGALSLSKRSVLWQSFDRLRMPRLTVLRQSFDKLRMLVCLDAW